MFLTEESGVFDGNRGLRGEETNYRDPGGIQRPTLRALAGTSDHRVQGVDIHHDVRQGRQGGGPQAAQRDAREAGADKWVRTLRLDRGRNTVEVDDRYTLRGSSGKLQWTLMSALEPRGDILQALGRHRQRDLRQLDPVPLGSLLPRVEHPRIILVGRHDLVARGEAEEDDRQDEEPALLIDLAHQAALPFSLAIQPSRPATLPNRTPRPCLFS